MFNLLRVPLARGNLDDAPQSEAFHAPGVLQPALAVLHSAQQELYVLPLAPVIAWNWIEPEVGSPRLAVAVRGGTAGVWDVQKTNFVIMVNRSGEVWTTAAWDAAGRFMARLNPAGNLEVLHFASAEIVFQRDRNATTRPLLAMAPDGSRVASTTANGDVVVYRIPDGTTIALLPRRQDEVTALSFLPGGSLLTGTRDGTVWKWEPMTMWRSPSK